MKEGNVIQEKSYQFALEIVMLYKWLCEERKEFTLSKQLVRSGTSVGANVEEAIGGQSEPDFLHKLSIAYKEARESNYWLRLLRDSNFIPEEKSGALIEKGEEVLRILGSIIKTIKGKRGVRIRN